MKKLPLTNNEYQVFFFICPANIPFHFFVHPWVVTVHGDQINRWEVIRRKNDQKEHFGHVYRNFYSDPVQSLKRISFSPDHWSQKSVRLLGLISGDSASVARRVFDFVEQQSPSYKHQDFYQTFPGPNSNTYVQWVLDNFPGTNIKLPWNAFGKNFEK